MTMPNAVRGNGIFSQTRYLIRRKIFTIMGKKFHVYDAAGNLVGFSKMKAFKLKEDIRLYTGEDMQTELLTIKARNIIDFSAFYDVVDAPTGQKLGALKRRGMKSMLKDEWLILDASDREIGMIEEDNWALALVRRFVEIASLFLPQKYLVKFGGAPVAEFKQNFNPFVYKLNLDFSADQAGRLDKRLGLAAAILLAGIEGKQK